MTIGDRLEKWACWLDGRPGLMLVLLATVYVILVQPSVYRHLWFDELLTYYIAQAPSFAQFVTDVRQFDLHPPLTFALTRASMKLFGPSELGARLPVILGYFLASAGMFVFLTRRVGPLWASAGVGLLWFNPFFYYATEARPYGILLGCLGLMLVSWDYSVDTTTALFGRRWALAGVALGGLGMLLTHVYAPLWIMPFWAAEVVRNWRQRRIDWPLWAVLGFPMAATAIYIPLIHYAGNYVFPPALQGSPEKALWFYVLLFFQVLRPLGVATLLAFAVALWRRSRSEAVTLFPVKTGFQDCELTLLTVSLLPPAILNAVSMVRHIAYNERHALPTLVMGYILIILFIAYESRANRLAGLAAAIVILGFTLFPTVHRWLDRATATAGNQIPYDQIHPELPFVTNSGLTFLEMDHYENPALVARLYYLVDRESAIRYDHANLTEVLAYAKESFHIRARVSPYSDFIARHRHFLVWGVIDQSGWLLRKLKTEGAQVNEIGKFYTVYADSQLFEVNLDP